MKAPDAGGPSKYDALVKYHLDDQDFAHGSGYFWPWHRAYLRTFEIALQAIDPTVCLPYWNWSVDSQAPEACAIFTNDYYGGNGDSSTNCVTSGSFAGWSPYYPKPHCLQRKYAYGDNLGAYQSTEGVNRMITSSNDYATAADQIENAVHGAIHVSIGGDMNQMQSPNDPIFWLHHGYIDYLWAIWQARKGTDFGGKAKDGSNCVKSTQMLGLNFKVVDVLDYRSLCYQYENMDPGVLNLPTTNPAPTVDPNMKPDITPIPSDSADTTHNCNDRSSLSDLRYPQPVTQDFCKMNGLDFSHVQSCEKDYQDNCYKKLNQLKGFVSPCALLKRPDLAQPYIAPGKDVYIDVAGLGRIKYNPISNEATQVVANVDNTLKNVAPDYDKVDPNAVQQIVGAEAFTASATNANVSTVASASSAQKEAAGFLVGLAGAVYALL